MKAKKLLCEQIEREREYLSNQEVGTDEYNASMERLVTLQKELANIENSTNRNVIEGVKVAGGIVLPIIGLVGITAFEKDSTFTSALRGYVNCFLPKK